jgi:hypothetical protein
MLDPLPPDIWFERLLPNPEDLAFSPGWGRGSCAMRLRSPMKGSCRCGWNI